MRMSARLSRRQQQQQRRGGEAGAPLIAEETPEFRTSLSELTTRRDSETGEAAGDLDTRPGDK
jgi:hypothetical protein